MEVEWSDIVKEAQAYMEDKGGTYSPRLRADSESHWIENDSNTFSFEVTYLRSFALLHSHLAFVSVSKQIFNDTLNFRIENWKTLQSRYATDNPTLHMVLMNIVTPKDSDSIDSGVSLVIRPQLLIKE